MLVAAAGRFCAATTDWASIDLGGGYCTRLRLLASRGPGGGQCRVRPHPAPPRRGVSTDRKTRRWTVDILSGAT
eukprot:scaffold140056_cov60-Phaeocystis_antarctica.AAC.7